MCSSSHLNQIKFMSQRILVVDDEAPTRELLSLYFKKLGYDVSTASTAEGALRLVNEIPLQLVILDLNLGDADGLDLLEPIQKAHPRIPIIIYSGIGSDDQSLERALARQKGVTSYIHKTQPLDQMLAEVKRLLQT